MAAVSPAHRVAVAMSGGVDSSVAAAILAEAGHDVFGVTLRLQSAGASRPGRACPGEEGVERARAVAARLGIPHQVLDRAEAFEALVLEPAWNEYARGRTPSPCLSCNEYVKFGLLLEWARSEGADRLATGHYARIGRSPSGGPALLRGSEPGKDQSYFLAGLTPERLAVAIFPLGGLTKAEVRERAARLGLPSARAPESQDACFSEPGRPFSELLRARFAGRARPGAFVDAAGNVLGAHPGIHLYTIGQRRGLRLPVPTPHFVRAIRERDAAIEVTADPAALSAREVEVSTVIWHDGPLPERVEPCEVQFRYRQAAVGAQLEREGESALRVRLDRPVRAVAPGQAAVFYSGERVLGRGWIDGWS